MVSLFSRNHGHYRSIARGANNRRQRGVYQPGNLVHAHWNARLAEQMGQVRCEVIKPIGALVMRDAEKLAGLSSVCSLLDSSLHERDAHPILYDAALHLLQVMLGDADWLAEYVRFEMTLLREAGFGLDMSCCAATGAVDELVYISPKSGRAVCREAGAPYHEKMLPLPHFLLEEDTTPKPAEILDGIALGGYFLQHRLFAAHDRELPAARRRLAEMVRQVELAD